MDAATLFAPALGLQLGEGKLEERTLALARRPAGRPRTVGRRGMPLGSCPWVTTVQHDYDGRNVCTKHQATKEHISNQPPTQPALRQPRLTVGGAPERGPRGQPGATGATGGAGTPEPAGPAGPAGHAGAAAAAAAAAAGGVSMKELDLLRSSVEAHHSQLSHVTRSWARHVPGGGQRRGYAEAGDATR